MKMTPSPDFGDGSRRDEEIWRRGRDSNPRYRKAVQRFSKPPRSAAPAPLRHETGLFLLCVATLPFYNVVREAGKVKGDGSLSLPQGLRCSGLRFLPWPEINSERDFITFTNGERLSAKSRESPASR